MNAQNHQRRFILSLCVLALAAFTVGCDQEEPGDPIDQCQAIPACEDGESSSQDACGEDEADCRAETLCGSTIYCRAEINCGAVPMCDDGQIQGQPACGDDEAGCGVVG